MSGVTKHIYAHEIYDILGMWDKQLEHISRVLREDYEDRDIVSALKLYYPYEWESVEVKYDYYTIKDKHIKKKKGKYRYEMKKPEDLLHECWMYKKLISDGYKEKHKEAFFSEKQLLEVLLLWDERKHKIDRITKKIKKAKEKTQQVTPEFLDKLIGLYDRNITSQKDKMYFILEFKNLLYGTNHSIFL